MKPDRYLILSILILISSLFSSAIPFYNRAEFYDTGFIPLIIKGSVNRQLLEDIGCRIMSQREDYTFVRLPVEQLGKLDLFENYTIYPAKPDEPLLEQSTSDLKNGSYYAGCNADAAQAAGIDGDNVIIGILDYYPLNWKHEDFHETGWNTNDLRVLYIWNQQDDSGTHPSGFDFGSEYTKADLMADNGPLISGGSHGTQCSGIAAGDGSASGAGSPRMGIAPAADIIYIHKIWDDTGTINAINYFQDKADELQRPIVISFSGGTKYGFPDGSDLVSQTFDNFCQTERLIAVAGGNYYTTSDHALGTATFGNPSQNIIVTIDSYTNSGSEPFDDLIDAIFFFKQGDNCDIEVTDPGFNSYITTILDDDEVFDTPYGRLYLAHNDDASIEVVITDEVGIVSSGDSWKITLSVPDPAYDDEGGNWSAWIYEKNITGHFSTYNSSDVTLNIYATGQDCISVAAHSKTSGSMQSYSSAGLTYDGRQKPEISAPTGAYTANNSGTNTYSALGGTSGAAPHVAGTLALMLQRFPGLTPDLARQQLIDYTYTDAQTAAYGTEPNKRFGYGKLNSFRAVFPQLDAPENVQITLQNNNSEIKINWDNEGFEYRIYSSSNPAAGFPGDDWTLEAVVTDTGELILSNSFGEKKFFLVTVD